MKILLLASQHGDEQLGERLYAHIETQRPKLMKHVEFMIGNPRAHAKGVRYIESDLNRSYNGKSDTYEQRRATEILRHIRENNFNLVLDLHTTSCDQPPCLIVASINPYNEVFFRASSVEHLVIMEPKTVSTALNGVCAQAISIELNRNFTDEYLSKLCDDTQRYVRNESHVSNRYVYEVDLLRKDEIGEDEYKLLRNFELSPKGYYPVLVGEDSYLKSQYDYLGFKAYKRRAFKL